MKNRGRNRRKGKKVSVFHSQRIKFATRKVMAITVSYHGLEPMQGLGWKKTLITSVADVMIKKGIQSGAVRLGAGAVTGGILTADWFIDLTIQFSKTDDIVSAADAAKTRDCVCPE